jgi:hypothetical protein
MLTASMLPMSQVNRNGKTFRTKLLVAAAAGVLSSAALWPQDAKTTDQMNEPREVLTAYPPFTVMERVPFLEEEGLYPCSDCHDGDFVVTNPRARELVDMHEEVELVHGGGRFWCLTCHGEDDRDVLSSLKKQPISFNESFLLCGQCHFQRQKDFFTGAHGKRVDSWQGERTLLSCTGCHNAHDPAIAPRKPFGPPALRSGLTPVGETHSGSKMPWERSDPHTKDKESSDGQ